MRTARVATKPMLRSRPVTHEALVNRLLRCTDCERLTRYRENVPARRSLGESRYWRRAVPGFGDPDAWLLIIGLAPAAHGGNRTGRVFTGDKSGEFLVESLYRTGFANQPISVCRGDGLAYTGCYLTAAVKCAPPSDRPTREEFANCRCYLRSEIELLTGVTHVLALGEMAFRAYIDALRENGLQVGQVRFSHGAAFVVGRTRLFASYHPSPRNTYTRRLTMQMMIGLLNTIKADKGGEREV